MMTSIVNEFLVVMLDYSMCAYFCIKILQNQFKISLRNTVFGALCFTFCYTVIDLILSNSQNITLLPFINSTVTGLLWMFITYKTLSYVTKESTDKLLFLLFMGHSILMLCRSVTLLCYGMFFPELLTDEYTLVDLLGFGLPVVLLMPLFTKITKKYYLSLKELDDNTYPRLWLIPLFFYILSTLQVNLYPSDEYILANSVKISIILCAFITYSQMVNAVVKTESATKESESKKQLLYQLTAEKARLADLENYIEEIKRIRHDHRQHLNVLHGLLELGKMEEMQTYLNEYEHKIIQTIKPPLCENHVVDTLCRRYEALALQSNIKVTISISLPQAININSGDLAVIIGNLWENAITATLDAIEPHRFIQLWIQMQKDKILIRMENGYGGVILQEKERFLSTKDSREHEEGFGINSIKSIAKSYDGVADFSYTQDVFTASILLYTTNIE